MEKSLFSRRRFLSGVGQGTLLATVGPSLALELGLVPRGFSAEGPELLDFGELESLVAWMQETPLDRIQRGLVDKLAAGTPLKRLVAAAALANARHFGGEDYVGFHTFMALAPALGMAGLLRGKEAPLPVMKVLYRNTHRLQETGDRGSDALRAIAPATGATPDPAALRDAVRKGGTEEAERLLLGFLAGSPEGGFDALLHTVQENVEVHRTVLPYRAWEMIDLVGPEHAGTLLRQSLRYCLDAESHRRAEWERHGRVLADLLEGRGLLDREPGTREADDDWIRELAKTVFEGTPEDASGAVAAALAEGFRPTDLGEALSLAANRVVLQDPGRIPAWESPGKVAGSVHGDSVGVHCSDAANAWRHLARVSRGRNVHACLILGAWQVARDRGGRSGLLEAEAVPSKRQLGSIAATEPAAVLAELDEAVRANLQGQAAAAVRRAEALGHPEGPVFEKLLHFAVSEDGALHAEKYFHTVWDDFHAARPAFRWNHLVGLARVTASEFGHPAPGGEEARDLLGL